MSHSPTTEPEEGPPAPDICEECDGTDFTPRSKAPGENVDTEKEYVFAYHECADCGARYNDRSSQLLNPDNVRIPEWEEIFGHPEPYPHQRTAIKDIIQTSLSDGYTVMEGGCGTGKTMISLTAGLRLVMDPRTKFERIMVLTSVKQQLRQFESDLKIINSNLPEDISPARAVTLVGKTDLCPYSREEKAGFNKENVTRNCRTLRDQTSKIMSDGMDGAELARAAVDGSKGWSSGGADSPYSDVIPQADLQYCPFYANYKEHGDPLFTFGHAPDCILHPDEIVNQAVQKGVCPHSAMSVLLRDADVVIANYYHAFDGNTLQITHPVVDDTTLLICDEAHMLEPRVRGILSTSVPMYGIKNAASEVGAVYNAVRSGDKIQDDDIRTREPPQGVVLENLQKEGVQPGVLKDVYYILQRIGNTLDSSVQSYLDDEFPNWRNDRSELGKHEEIPLRDPTKKERDTLTQWIEKQDIPDQVWEFLPKIAKAVSESLSEGSEDGGTSHSIDDVAELFNEWFGRDHTKYFREITLHKEDDAHPAAEGWNQHFQADVQIHSVMPRAVIGGRIDSFGAGILMSATLEPMDVYREVTGMDFLSEMENTLVTNRTYNSSFPEKNRLSITLDLPKFTYENRGDIEDDTETRRQYSKAIRALARTTPGNVLVCMPSYREGQWAAAILKHSENVSKDVLLDESSSEGATQALKQEFIEGEGKVLVTSLRGTLTEGVDFDEDKLLSCIVCGVPIENVGSPKTKAVRTAYEDQFGGLGFDYGLTVPAVRKTRQALGRVIRGDDEVGVRVAADKRYSEGGQGSVRKYLSEKEQAEYESMDDVNEFYHELKAFWNAQS